MPKTTDGEEILHAGDELGQARLKLRLEFTLNKIIHTWNDPQLEDYLMVS